jgi:hypothetical protein
MTQSAVAKSRWGVTQFAFAVALLHLTGAVYYGLYLIANGYLPGPFANDKSDTLMDLFNPLYWAYDLGRYTEWGSVYPPLNFWILKLLGLVFLGGGGGAPDAIRDSSPWLIAAFCLIYLVVPAFVLKTTPWRSFSILQKLSIYAAIVLSTPALFALERGNLVVICPIFLCLVISKTGYSRCFYIALLINIKPYFLLLVFYYLVRRNWRGLVVCSGLSGFLFVLTGVALDHNFQEILTNLSNFSHGDVLFSVREVLSMPSSVSAFSYALKHPEGASFAFAFLGNQVIDWAIFAVDATKWILLGVAFSVLIVKAHVVRDAELFVLLVVIITNLGVSVGGYSLVFYMVLIPVLLKMRASRIYLFLITLLAAPLDFFPLMADSLGEQYSYLSDSLVDVEWSLGLGSVVRPCVNLLLLPLLVYEISKRNHQPKVGESVFVKYAK